ncbi:MAG: hypothetical protein ABFD97_12345 [Syntrophobacter sp.]
MKIDSLLNSQIIQGKPEVDQKGAAGREDVFAALLQNEMTNVEETMSQPGVSGIDAGLQISPIQALSGDSGTMDGIAGIQDVISKLQSLEKGLQENKSPKDIDGIITEMGDAAAKLKDNTNSLPENTELSDMAEEVKVTAYMESIKWRRGDYL